MTTRHCDFVDRIPVSVEEDEIAGLYRKCDARMFLDRVSWISSQRRVRMNVEIIHAAECLPPFFKLAAVVLFSPPLLCRNRVVKQVNPRTLLMCAYLKSIIM